MKLVLAAALALGALTTSVTASSAMSIAQPASGGSGLVQDVRWGCPLGWHPNYWGRCVPNARPVYYYGYHPYYRPYYHPYYYNRWHRW